MATQNQSPTFEIVPLSKLLESKTNPRRNYDPVKLQELADSIQSHGVLQPLLVRPMPGDKMLEIVAGARRYRAALLAKEETVPVTIRSVRDIEVREMQLIENVQREDTHALDEALGYQALLALGGPENTVAKVAAKVGKSESYVYQRMKLAELIPDAQAAFLENRMSSGHAVQIARLQADAQPNALDYTLGVRVWPGRSQKTIKKDRKEAEAEYSVRELGGWIERQVHCKLHAAPFKKADAELVPEAGPCTTCPKRSGFSPALFPEIKDKDTCTDPTCYRRKIGAFFQIETKQITKSTGKPPLRVTDDYSTYEAEQLEFRDVLPREKWKEVSGKTIIVKGLAQLAGQCPSVTRALVVVGKRWGRSLWVCANLKCKVHFARKAGSSGASASESSRQKAIKRDIAIQKEIRAQLLSGIMIGAKLKKKIERADLDLVAASLFGALDYEDRERLLIAWGWKEKPKKREGFGAAKEWEPATFLAKVRKLPDSALHVVLVEMALAGSLEVNHYRRNWQKIPELLQAYALRFKIKAARTAGIVKQSFARAEKERAGKARAAKRKVKETVHKLHPKAKAGKKGKAKRKLQTSAKSKPKAQGKRKPAKK